MNSRAKTILFILSWLLLSTGVVIALYFCIVNYWLHYSAYQQAIQAHQDGFSYDPMDAMDRLVGEIFGLGIAFLGMFGLSISKRNQGL